MGLFARALCKALPELPVVDESELLDPLQRKAFLRRIHAHHPQQQTEN